MKHGTRRLLGVGRLLRHLRLGRATLADRAWTLSTVAIPLSRFLGDLRERLVVMRRSAIDISLNAARLNARTRGCRDMSREQVQQAEGLAQRSEHFDDQVALNAARATGGVLCQTYMRDTGEIITDISMPVDIDGRRWGAIRIGVDYIVFDQAVGGSAESALNGSTH